MLGKGTLTIVDGRHLEGSNVAEVRDHEPLAFAGLCLHTLAPGWRFNIDSRAVRLPAGTPAASRVAAQ